MSATIKFPQEICFAFSPNYIEIKGADTDTKATVKVEGTETKTFDVGIMNGEAKIYISRWLQLLFGDPHANYRCSRMNLEVKLPSKTSSDYSEHLVIWGSLEPVKRFATVGSYAYDPNEVAFVRRVRWFKAYPFYLSFFSMEGATYQTRYDSNGYGSKKQVQQDGYSDFEIARLHPEASRQIVYKITSAQQIIPPSPFDDTFDYTFKQLASGTSLIRINVDNSTEGHYFRWLDSFGQLQYFLFAPHSNSVKTKHGDTIDADICYNGTYYGGGKRDTNIEKSKTVKCCAMNLTEEEAEYVRSIVYSVEVDLYLGKTKEGEEIWVPCTVSDGTFSQSEKDAMQDFEITANIPTAQTQSI